MVPHTLILGTIHDKSERLILGVQQVYNYNVFCHPLSGKLIALCIQKWISYESQNNWERIFSTVSWWYTSYKKWIHLSPLFACLCSWVINWHAACISYLHIFSISFFNNHHEQSNARNRFNTLAQARARGTPSSAKQL